MHGRFNIYDLFASRGKERGFTIIELLVSMAIASLVAMAGFALFSKSNWSYQVQENVGEAQQNARVAMGRIARDIRMAGFGLPDFSYSLSFSASGPVFTYPITVTDNASGPDTITILGIGYEEGELLGVTTTPNAFICYSSTTINSNHPKGRILDGGTALVKPGTKYVSIDGIAWVELDTSTASIECGSSKRRTLPIVSSGLSSTLTAGTVYIIQAIEYSIVNTDNVINGCSAANPCLVSKDYSGLRGTGDANPNSNGRELLAENIEDIQFAYGIASGNVVGSETDCATGLSATPGFKCSPASGEESKIRAVRASLAARTRNRDPKASGFTRPKMENHPESDPPDSYRRRVLTKIIKVRN